MMMHYPAPSFLLAMALAAIVVSAAATSRAPAAEPDPEIAAIAQEITAEALLKHVDALVDIGTRRWDQPGGREAEAYIRGFLSSLRLDEVRTHDFDAGSDNVVAVLRGATRPARVHVLGAHYDSVASGGPEDPAPGADDNASGTAALLEIARALSAPGRRPAETIVLVAFSAEEQGRLGSGAFVADLATREETVVDMICLDVIGYLEPGTQPDLSVSSSEFPPEVLALIDSLRQSASIYLPSWRFEGGPGCG